MLEWAVYPFLFFSPFFLISIFVLKLNVHILLSRVLHEHKTLRFSKNS
jgi:hypothetical protein